MYCEALQIESNFLRRYNVSPRLPITDQANALVVNAWYRQLLGGVETRQEAELEIVPAKHVLERVRLLLRHPQIVIR